MNPLLMLDVMRFELSRSMTKGRILIWCGLVGFPVVLFFLLSRIVHETRVETWGSVLHYLVTEIVVLLSLLLWATPVVSTEIEGQTWIYLATRRSGRSMVLFGKYLTAVIWSFAAAVTAISLCMMIVPAIGGFQLWSALLGLSLLSCVAHAAIFVLIGVLFHRRTMVTAVVYSLLIEYGLAMVPAVASKFTVNYRLRWLLAEWMDWEEALSELGEVFDREPTSIHLLVLAAITMTTLFASVFWLQRAQYPTQQDG